MKLYTLLAMTACLVAAPAVTADVLLVGNKSAHTLWALDLASGERQAEFETGIGPHEVEVSSDQRYAVVSNYGDREAPGNTLTVIEWPSERVVRTIDLGADTRPHGMAFLTGHRLAVTTEGSNSLLVVDVGLGTVVSLSSHVGALPAVASVALPVAETFEIAGSFVNAQGMTQSFSPVLSAPAGIEPAWKTIAAMGRALGHDLGFDGLDSLRRDLGDRAEAAQ